MVKRALFAVELAKLENMEVTDEEVNQEIEAIAAKEGRKALAIRAALEADKKLDSLQEEILARKMDNFLLENNTVKTEPAKGADDTDSDSADEPTTEE